MATYATKSNPFISIEEPAEKGDGGGHTDLLMICGNDEPSDGVNFSKDIEAPISDESNKNNSSELKENNDSDKISSEEVCSLRSDDTLDVDLSKSVIHRKVSGDAQSKKSDDDNPNSTSQIKTAPGTNNNIRNHHLELIHKLRLQLKDLEQYAYDRGELDILDEKSSKIPAYLLAERQRLVIEALQKKFQLSLGPDDIEKLDYDQLKRLVNREIEDSNKINDQLVGQLASKLRYLEDQVANLKSQPDGGKDNQASRNIAKQIEEAKLDISRLKAESCSCRLHHCESKHQDDDSSVSTAGSKLETKSPQSNIDDVASNNTAGKDMNDKTAPKSSNSIRNLVAHIICSDVKLRERDRKSACCDSNDDKISIVNNSTDFELRDDQESEIYSKRELTEGQAPRVDPNLYDDEPTWLSHINKVILATDSLINLFETNLLANGGSNSNHEQVVRSGASHKKIDENLVESIVRRQLVPALRDLLAYGLVESDANQNVKSSLIFDPYSLISSWICFPGNQPAKAGQPFKSVNSMKNDEISYIEKPHVWNAIQDYYNTRNEPAFNSSSIKTLSQSFNLAPSISGSIKITSKQALIIAVDDIIDNLSKCKPNGPESHFRLFIYTGLNRRRLSIWTRLIFRNKSIIRRHYHNHSFVNQTHKMEQLLKILEVLNKYDFKLRSDGESIEQFVSAF